jgi:hypothetical protein
VTDALGALQTATAQQGVRSRNALQTGIANCPWQSSKLFDLSFTKGRLVGNSPAGRDSKPKKTEKRLSTATRRRKFFTVCALLSNRLEALREIKVQL